MSGSQYTYIPHILYIYHFLRALAFYCGIRRIVFHTFTIIKSLVILDSDRDMPSLQTRERKKQKNTVHGNSGYYYLKEL